MTLSLLLALMLSAQATPSNPVLVIYEQRVDAEKMDLDRKKRNLDYTAEMKGRLEPIEGAVSTAYLEGVRLEADLAKLRVESAEARVRMAAAMMEIARARLAAGQEAPVCGLPTPTLFDESEWDLPGVLRGGR